MSRLSSMFATFALVGFTAVPASALAAKAEFHLDTSAVAPKRLEVAVRWLDVQVKPIAGDKVTVKADLVVEASGGEEKAQKCLDKNKVTLEISGDTLTIRQGEDRAGWRGNCVFVGFSRMSGTLEVGVPAGISLVVGTASGDVEMKGDFGAVPVQVAVASGDVRFSGQASELELSTASGDATLALEKPVRRFKAELASGSLRMTGGAEEATASTASGDLELENLLGSAHVETASGDIRLGWDRFAAGSEIDAEAASGDVTITLPAGVTLTGRLETSSGRLQTDQAGKPGPDRGTFLLEGSDGQIMVDTASGDVTLRNR